MTSEASPSASAAPERQFPPIVELAVGSMILVVIGGIYLAASLPRHVSLGPAVGLVVASGVLLLADVGMLSRLRDFAWDKFFLVGGWALFAYVFIAGMIEYVFVVDQTRGGALLVLTLMLVLYAVDIPLILAFSVARYQPARPSAER